MIGSMYFDRDGNPIDLQEWVRLFEQDRTVSYTEFTSAAGSQVRVSTVYLGLNHNYSDVGPPLIFETMVFCEDYSGEYQKRYSTEDEAIEGHATAVAWARANFLAIPSIPTIPIQKD